ncbi:periplasmic heavy metal sensor [Puniceibacterium confluentis]|uniref:periplasmic heavy metal sensor n=1 Tax=Puniceibacterium confluentis TaxID=1958944 RepID=UPI0011B759A9|nr:periplasmic heavy metal sensor [Puniceibacterium confluentis]
MAKPATTENRWVKPVMIASLALNLAFVGAVVGYSLVGGRHGREGHSAGRADAMPYMRALTDTDRHRLRDALRQDFRQYRGTRGQITEDYGAALAALRADPFDRASLSAVLDRQSARANDRLQGGQRVLADFVAAMSADERSAYADRLAHQIERLAERWDHLDRKSE